MHQITLSLLLNAIAIWHYCVDSSYACHHQAFEKSVQSQRTSRLLTQCSWPEAIIQLVLALNTYTPQDKCLIVYSDPQSFRL